MKTLNSLVVYFIGLLLPALLLNYLQIPASLEPARFSEHTPHSIQSGHHLESQLKNDGASMIIQSPIVFTVTVTPQTSGTVRRFPELGITGIAPVGSSIQSKYFKTTPTNREFRRGFFELVIPDLPGQVLSATLILDESSAIVTAPVPPVLHELSFYDQADLSINTDDFDRATSYLNSFETDANTVPETFSFDVTTVISQAQSNQVGFRVKLALDPTYNEFDSFGPGFDPTLIILVDGYRTHLPIITK